VLNEYQPVAFVLVAGVVTLLHVLLSSERWRVTLRSASSPLSDIRRPFTVTVWFTTAALGESVALSVVRMAVTETFATVLVAFVWVVSPSYAVR
jgi:hypothetical protein